MVGKEKKKRGKLGKGGGIKKEWEKEPGKRVRKEKFASRAIYNMMSQSQSLTRLDNLAGDLFEGYCKKSYQRRMN